MAQADTAGRHARKLHSLRAGRQLRLDSAKLYALGYQQELKRGFSLINNMGCAMCLASCFLIPDVYAAFKAYGGPVTMMWCWVIATLGMLCTASVLAELVSAFPTSGGLYYYSYILAPPRWRAFLSWITGYLNLVGQLTATLAFELSFVDFLVVVVSMHISGPEDGPGWQPTKPQMMGMYAAAVAMHAGLSCISQQLTAAILSFGTFWHLISAPAFMIVLLMVAPERQDISWVFTQWIDNSRLHGISSPGYVILLGLMMPCWVQIVFDSSAHLVEDTVQADSVACWAMVSSVALNGVLGLAMLGTFNACVKSFDAMVIDASGSDGWLLAKVAGNVFKQRYGYTWAALPVLYMALIALFICPVASFVSNSRMVYAFSRDGAMLGSKHWRKVQSNGIPVNGTLMMAGLALPLGLISIFSHRAAYGFNCLLAMCMNVSMLIPLLLRLLIGAKGFIAGPFCLGRWGIPMTAVSCAWLILTTSIFCLPTALPASQSDFHIAIGLFGGLLLLLLLSWWCPSFGKQFAFHGPVPNIAAINEQDSVEPSSRMSTHKDMVGGPLNVVDECIPLEARDSRGSAALLLMQLAAVPAERLSLMMPSYLHSRGSTGCSRRLDEALVEGIEICAGRQLVGQLMAHTHEHSARSRTASAVTYDAGSELHTPGAPSGVGSAGDRPGDEGLPMKQRAVLKAAAAGIQQYAAAKDGAAQVRKRKNLMDDHSSSGGADGEARTSSSRPCLQANGSPLPSCHYSMTGSEQTTASRTHTGRSTSHGNLPLAAAVSAAVASTTHASVPSQLVMSGLPPGQKQGTKGAQG